MHRVVALGEHLDAARDQPVLQPADGKLIAWDDLRGKDHGVAAFKADARVAVTRNARHRRARLALAARADIERPCGVECGAIVFTQEPQVFGNVPGRARRADIAPERAPHQHGHAAIGDRGMSRRTEPRDVGGE